MAYRFVKYGLAVLAVVTAMSEANAVVVVGPAPRIVVRPAPRVWVAPRVVVYGPRPVYYVPGPLVVGGVVVNQPSGVWYYCDPARAYYPYVAQCEVPWRTVPAMPKP